MLTIPIPSHGSAEDPAAAAGTSADLAAALSANDSYLAAEGVRGVLADAALQLEARQRPGGAGGSRSPLLQRLATIGRAGDSSGPQSKLFEYWTRGVGAAKIRWGTDGSFARCKRLLGRHLPPNYSLGGLCANLHKRATGEWPTEHGKAGIPS